MALAALLTTAAHAQMTDVTLVSNITQSSAGIHGRTEVLSQRFDTGAEPFGYLLKSVEVSFQASEGSSVSGKVCTVTGTDQPTSTCTDFITPAADGGIRTFFVPGDGMVLRPNTKYAVVLTPPNSSTLVRYTTTNSNGEDSGGLSGWNIAGEYRLDNGTSWEADGDSRALRIRLKGVTRTLAANANANATGTPAIAGPAQVGATLTARMGDIADPDGLPSGSFADAYFFQWLRVETNDDFVAIPGATSDEYTPVTADLNRTLKVRVSFLDGGNEGESLTSAGTNPVVPDAAPCPAGAVWCTVLTSGARAAGEDSPTVGFRVSDAFGSLDDDTFTFGGTTYTVTTLVSGGASAIDLNTAPLLPVDGGGLTLHVQRLSGTLDLALDAAFGSPHTGANWNWNGVVGTGPSNPVLLRMFRRVNEHYQGQTDPGTRITVWLSRQPGVSFEQPAHIAYEAGEGAEVTVTLTPAPASNTSIPITATAQDGATSADWSGVPSILTFTAGQSSRTFTVTARSDSTDESGESVLLGFGTLPAGTPAGYLTTATVHLLDPASTGDARLTNNAGVPTSSGEGRLEVFYRGAWGTVCDDRFDRPFTIFARTRRTVDNHAATFACGLMGYNAGETIDNGAYRLGDSDPTPIWLDDVRCEEGGRHHTGLVPTQLDHCFHAGLGLHNCNHSEDVALRCTEPNLQVAEPALRARLQVASRTHDGTSAFTFRIAFTVAVTISPTALRDEALTVTGATLTAASPVDARGDLWEIEARPTGTSNVVIEVPIRACGEAGALCTAAGLPLAHGAIELIVYEAPPGNLADEDDPDADAPAPLTAEFTGVPDEHDGASAFTFRLAFSEAIRNGYRRVRDDLLSATGGTVTRAGRVNGRSDLWRIEVAPSGHGAVTVTLASGADCATAPCASDGGTLPAPVTATIEGPPGLSVADAQVEEGPDATLAFPITLDRAATRTVSVRAATSDGTATAGEDYRAKTLTKTFAPGETRKVAVIRVLEDTVDDDGETMTLTLSNPSGAHLADAEATGTIGAADAVQDALVDGAAVVLAWPTPRDGFGTPSGSDYAVRVNGAARRVVSAQLSGRTGHLELASPVVPGDAVTVSYVGSAMHPLADASGLRSGPWDGLTAVNVTGTEHSLPVPVAPMPHGSDPLASAATGALRLNASGLGLTDLTGLARLTALERLDLSGNALTDLAPLSGLANLRDLDLSDNHIADLWPLAGLQGLERLDVSGNQVVDLSALSGLAHLRVLVLDGNAVTDVGALTHLTRLENLGLASAGVLDVTALQDLPALRRLDLGGTGVGDLSPLTDVGSLVWLSLPGNALVAPETLGRLTRLRWLWSGTDGTDARDNADAEAIR